MLIRDAMSTRLITIAPQATISEAIGVMLKRRVSGLPVVDGEGQLVGLLSEGDLLRRVETGTQHHRPRWLEWLLDSGRRAAEYAHSHGRLVHEVMTTRIWTVSEKDTLADAVALMERHHVKRLPVVRNGQLVGIVTRSDLMRALAGFVATTYEDTFATDDEIRSAILAELKSETWAPAQTLAIKVDDGVVTLDGAISDDRERDAVGVLVENIPGVKAVIDRLVWINPTPGASPP